MLFRSYYNSSGSIALTGGQAYYIDVWYYENGGGAAAMLFWNTGAGITIVPSSNFATASNYWAPQNQTTVGTSSGITNTQQTTKNSLITNRNSVSNNSIYVDQAGDNNTFNITQTGNNNSIQSINQQRALLKGNNNTVTIKQGNSSDAVEIGRAHV